MSRFSRRDFLASTSVLGAAGLVAQAGPAVAQDDVKKVVAARRVGPGPKLGMVTYNMGKDMDRPTLIKLCKEVGLSGVELRTTHAHGVEPTLSAEERAAVRREFEEGGIEIAGLGTTHEFHSKDPEEVKKHIEGSKAFAQLAKDVGAPGIKMRPNGLHADEPVEQTCERIGKAWREVAAFAGDLGVQARMEVHGKESGDPKVMRMMLDAADHPNAWICWNSNAGEQDENGSIKWAFDLLKHKIGLVHINDIGVYQYPWLELFKELRGIDYTGYCLAEIQYNPEPERFMKYYRTLFDLYNMQYRYPQK